jgi:hypothetical protein
MVRTSIKGPLPKTWKEGCSNFSCCFARYLQASIARRRRHGSPLVGSKLHSHAQYSYPARRIS